MLNHTNISTIATVITASSGVTIIAIDCRAWSKMRQLTIMFQLSTALTEGTLKELGVLNSGYRPVSTSFIGSNRFTGDIASNGTINLRSAIATAANTTYTVCGTFMVS